MLPSSRKGTWLPYREVYQNTGFRYRITAGGNIRFWTTESGGTIELGSATVISTDSFYHIVTTYDDTEARMYINGSLVHAGVSSAPPEVLQLRLLEVNRSQVHGFL